MLTTERAHGRRRLLKTGRTALLMLACTASAVSAQDAVPPPSWTAAVGVGVASTSIYPGARERYVMPFPVFEASYTRGTLSFSASMLNGLGVSYFQPSTGLLWSLAVAPGRRRARDGYSVLGIRQEHSAQAQTFLQNSSNASTPAAAVAMLALPTRVGIVGATIGYYPTTVTPAEAGSPKQVHHGMQYSLVYMTGLPVTDRLSLSGKVQLAYMSGSFASAWYTVEHDTPALPAFAAGSGFHDTQVGVQLNYGLTQRMAFSFLAAETWLLGDARKSPFTQAARSHDIILQLLYRL